MMFNNTVIKQNTKHKQNGISKSFSVANRKTSTHNFFLTKGSIYEKYRLPIHTEVSIKTLEKKVAVGELEWLILRKGCEHQESKWFTTTLSICLSLLFGSICLIGTAAFEQNGRVLWLPLLAAVAHIAGCVTFGLLSVYFGKKRKDIEQEPVRKLLKKRLDGRFVESKQNKIQK